MPSPLPPPFQPTSLEIRDLLACVDLSKTYGATKALSNVSMSFESGQVAGLVGSNGSGKSTLIKILAGVVDADPGGVITAGGADVDAEHWNAGLAADAGLSFVHQDLGLIGELSVSDNFALTQGFPRGLLGHIRGGQLRRRTGDAIDGFGLRIDPDVRVRDLSSVQQTMLAICRALSRNEAPGGRVLVLDEPTARLPPEHVDKLLAYIRECAGLGHSVLYVSHRLDEILDICDTVTVLRDGKIAGARMSGAISKHSLVEAITGHPSDEDSEVSRRASSVATRSALFQADDLRAPGIENLSLLVNRGEVVGLAGLEGSGGDALLRTVFGAATLKEGVMTLGEAPFHPTSPRAAIASGVAYVPADRVGDALMITRPITENLTAGFVSPFMRNGTLSRRRERSFADKTLHASRVRLGTVRDPIATLSGGNQQKVVIARCLAQSPRLLLLEEPTQGVDVGARTDIWTLLKRHVAGGGGVLVYSSDYDELARHCDRIYVMSRGHIVAELAGPVPEAKIAQTVHTANRDSKETS